MSNLLKALLGALVSSLRTGGSPHERPAWYLAKVTDHPLDEPGADLPARRNCAASKMRSYLSKHSVTARAQIGRLLLAIRRQLPHGTWLEWHRDGVPFTPSTAESDPATELLQTCRRQVHALARTIDAA